MAELRPRFELLSSLSAEAVMHHFADRLRSGSCPVCGLSSSDRIELYVPNERQHLWSPQLIVEVETHGACTRFRGRFGPHPHVWALCVGVGAIAAFGNLIALCVAMAQFIMNQTPSAAVSIPITFVFLLLWYAIAAAGRSLGGSQMDELLRFFEATLASAGSEAQVSATA
jgi:hypothetical protein